MEAESSEPAAPRSTECDYGIVGAGTAGCVLAKRLSADPNINVLLIEAGGPDAPFWIDIPVGYPYAIGNPRTDWCFETTPQPGLNGRAIGYARGKVLGGCSSINAMTYMRGQAADYDHWAQLGNRGWGWNDVLPVFKRSEDYQHGSDRTRRIMAAPALARFGAKEWKPGAHPESDDELAPAAGELGATIFHPVGICRMGTDREAVVDDRLRLKGVAGVRVIDASVMPRITSGNTNAPTLMIAGKGADFIRAEGAGRAAA